jgi:hypothetical protein
MLPFLPALLLLLLQGPSDFERLVAEGRLSSVLEKFVAESPKERKTLQALLVSGGHPELSRALAVLLTGQSEPEAKPAFVPPVAEERVVVPPTSDARPLPEGYADGRRTRDGPALLA